MHCDALSLYTRHMYRSHTSFQGSGKPFQGKLYRVESTPYLLVVVVLLLLLLLLLLLGLVVLFLFVNRNESDDVDSDN